MLKLFPFNAKVLGLVNGKINFMAQVENYRNKPAAAALFVLGASFVFAIYYQFKSGDLR